MSRHKSLGSDFFCAAADGMSVALRSLICYNAVKRGSLPVDNLDNIEAADNSEAERGKAKQSTAKKLMILYVLEILQRYSDKYHKLTQGDIISLIKQDYDMDCERKAISRHIKSLCEHGYKISTYEENGEGYYIEEREFSGEDAFMLWEGLMSSRCVSGEDIARLLQILNRFVGMTYRFSPSYYGGISSRTLHDRARTLDNLMLLMTEMAAKKKVSFNYNTYDQNGSFVSLYDTGITVSPYAILNIDNEYYLAAKREGETHMSAYRISYITEPEPTTLLADDISLIEGYRRGFDPEQFTAQFIPVFSGETASCLLKVDSSHMNEVVDAFGEDIRVLENQEGQLLINLSSPSEKMVSWAISHAAFSELIEPRELRYRVKDYFDEQSWRYR